MLSKGSSLVKVEVCCGSYEDAVSAYIGGADRIELNSALHLGGLTPTTATLKLVKEKVSIPVCCMVRPRGAGFIYSEKEIEVIFAEASELLENGADGIVFGFLNKDFEIDYNLTKKMVNLIHSYHKEAVFHRAFDCLKEPYKGIETLIELNVDRVLTSGLKNKAFEGKELLKELQARYGDRIEILAGSGVNSENVVELIKETSIKQVHSSCKGWKMDLSTHTSIVDYSYAKENEYEVVDSLKVKEIKDKIGYNC